MISAMIMGDFVLTENSNAARLLHNDNQFGTLQKQGNLELSFCEAAFLQAKKKLTITTPSGKSVTLDQFRKKALRKDKQFLIRYKVFSDLRGRGYTVKTSLKYGADFRVYDRGVRMGDDHAKWTVYAVHESDRLTWREFAAKNRVAHATKKKLLLGIVDDEGQVTYYQVGWIRP